MRCLRLQVASTLLGGNLAKLPPTYMCVLCSVVASSKGKIYAFLTSCSVAPVSFTTALMRCLHRGVSVLQAPLPSHNFCLLCNQPEPKVSIDPPETRTLELAHHLPLATIAITLKVLLMKPYLQIEGKTENGFGIVEGNV